MEIRVGTSGYSFEDWRGVFYPEKIEKGKMLDHYINHFNTVEINSTYYRVPHPRVMANIDKKVPDGFEFVVKVPQAMTHKRRDWDKEVSAYRDCLKPMEDSGRLKGVLAQFPYSFKFDASGLEYIKSCREVLSPHPLFVEFRHQSWVNRQMYDALKTAGVGYVAVDEPPLPGLIKPDLFNTTDAAYLRLHGRNSEHWWQGGPLRYDYNYSNEELDEWKKKIEQFALKEKAQKLYVFFNNCHLGQAVKNAREMIQKLNL